MTNASRIAKSVFYLSIICLIYFSLLVYWSFDPPESPGTLQFFGEMLTIPLLLGLLFTFFYSIVQLFRKQSMSVNFTSLVISGITIGMLIVVTILQSNG